MPKSTSYATPEHTEIVNLRRTLQQHFNLRSDRAGKMLCAELVSSHENTWVGWESDATVMHPAFWELANLKIAQLLTESGDLYEQWRPRIEELQTRKRRGPDSDQAKINREKRKELGLC